MGLHGVGRKCLIGVVVAPPPLKLSTLSQGVAKTP